VGGQAETLAYIDVFIVMAIAASIMFLLSFIVRKNDPKAGGGVAVG
jgi:DHA2 family multidrug resistance protein